MNKIVIVVLVLLVVGGAGYFLWRRRKGAAGAGAASGAAGEVGPNGNFSERKPLAAKPTAPGFLAGLVSRTTSAVAAAGPAAALTAAQEKQKRVLACIRARGPFMASTCKNA